MIPIVIFWKFDKNREQDTLGFMSEDKEEMMFLCLDGILSMHLNRNFFKEHEIMEFL